ncbi:glycosyltransferase family 2 protein [Aquimarina addita]|uniref:Glycosyltransferase family 2 protein n=1 Tax=Aquimarina addita TaxID=870485 RepID=A0ABP7XBH7_9FLAO
MRFSIIIPTLGRSEELILMLDSLLNQSFKDFEAIVVDQNEKDILTSIINSYKNSLVLKHIRIPARGASHARNEGMKIAEGSILTFPDDDCEYPNDFLMRVNTCFEENPEDGIVANTMDKTDGKAIANLSSNEIKIRRSNILKTVIEAGIFIKSNIADGIWFDEDLGVGSPSGYCSDEGPDFVLQLLAKGAEMKFYPDFRMFHPNPVRVYNEQTAIRAYKYGKGRGYFLRKNKFGLKGILYFLLLYILGMLKSIVFFNKQMFMYFVKGFKGRYEGYFKSK